MGNIIGSCPKCKTCPEAKTCPECETCPEVPTDPAFTTCSASGFGSRECADAVAAAYSTAHGGVPPWSTVVTKQECKCTKCQEDKDCPDCGQCYARTQDDCPKWQQYKDCPTCFSRTEADCLTWFQNKPANNSGSKSGSNSGSGSGCVSDTSSKTSNCGASTAEDFSKMMAQTNAFRASYGAGNLTWNADYADIARQSATLNANLPGLSMQHITCQTYGENLAKTTSKSCDLKAAAMMAECMWEGEASKWTPSGTTFTPDTGHFTQVVWKGTKQIGCAAVSGSSGTAVSCIYGDERGNLNTAEAFADNVGKLSGAAPKCPPNP